MTDKEKSAVLNDITIICDNREQKNQHILDYLDVNKISRKTEKMETADYTFILPHYPELNLDRSVLVEKKNSLDEIAGNFTKDRARFKREFERVKDEHIHLVIENATWKKVHNASYRSKMEANSMFASLLTWNIRYRCPVWFVGREESPELIYKIIYYEVKEMLNNY